MKRREVSFSKTKQLWKSVRFLSQSPSPSVHPERISTTLCQTNSRLCPGFLLPFKNIILWETQSATAWSSRQLSLFQVAVWLQAFFLSQCAWALHSHTATTSHAQGLGLLSDHAVFRACWPTNPPVPTGRSRGRRRAESLSSIYFNLQAPNPMCSGNV